MKRSVPLTCILLNEIVTFEKIQDEQDERFGVGSAFLPILKKLTTAKMLGGRLSRHRVAFHAGFWEDDIFSSFDVFSYVPKSVSGWEVKGDHGSSMTSTNRRTSVPINAKGPKKARHPAKRLTNHAVSGGIESRRCTALIPKPPHSRRSVSIRDAA